MSVFKALSGIDVNQHVEKKGQFTYLSWAWAVAELRKASPTATWEVIKTDGLPFCKTECGYFVEVAVTVDSITLSQIHPVLDNNNKTIPAPNAFQINTSIQRCLVKAIALHGLGLYIYAGEDLPSVELEPVDVYVAMIRNTKTMAELQKVFIDVRNQVKANPAYTAPVTKAKDDMKALFEGMAA
jgi:hypothetical protein